ncbi:hypothetical protein LG322_04195 [Microbacterium aerolatum]|uniref:hypothetical protein n=1 Tax=Microbacterium aerolatum TaxID=153731 RepID=UPI00384E8C54
MTSSPNPEPTPSITVVVPPAEPDRSLEQIARLLQTQIDQTAGGADLTWWLALAPILISVVGLIVAGWSLIYTLMQRPIPVLHAMQVLDTNAVGKLEYVGDVVLVFNVGKRPLPVQKVGVPQLNGDSRIISSSFKWRGGSATNPELPASIEPGQHMKFYFPYRSATDAERVQHGYRLDWLKRRRVWFRRAAQGEQIVARERIAARQTPAGAVFPP